MTSSEQNLKELPPSKCHPLFCAKKIIKITPRYYYYYYYYYFLFQYLSRGIQFSRASLIGALTRNGTLHTINQEIKGNS